MTSEMCSGCGLALALSGIREMTETGLVEYTACRNSICSQYGKRQGVKLLPKAVERPAQQNEETKSARSAFVMRKMQHKRK